MTKENTIRLFESQKVRVLWDDSTEKWYFSVIDIIKILSESKNPRRYWSDLKIKLKKEGSQLYEKIVQLKLGNSVISPLNAKGINPKNNKIEGEI